MKKSSLLGLSLVSLVSLVACNQAPAKSATQKAAEAFISYCYSSEQEVYKPRMGKGAPAYDEDGLWDVYADSNYEDKSGKDVDYFKIEGSKDSYEFCITTFELVKTAQGYSDDGEHFYSKTDCNEITIYAVFGDLLMGEIAALGDTWYYVELAEPLAEDEDEEVELFYSEFINSNDISKITLSVQVYTFMREFEADDGSKIYYTFNDVCFFNVPKDVQYSPAA